MELKTGVNINTGELQTERHGYFFYIYIYIHIQTDINIAEKIQFKENYVWNCNSSPLSKIPVKNPLVLMSNILPLNSGDITESLEIYSVPCSTKKLNAILKLKKLQKLLLLLCTVCTVGSQFTDILSSWWGYFPFSNHFYEHIWVTGFHYSISRERTNVQEHIVSHTCLHPYILHPSTGGCLQI